jgi:SAM-dependent methyltransferase
MEHKTDPIGQAILDFAKGQNDPNITVSSDLCEDDIIPVAHLFRDYDSMPKLEQVALSRCEGTVLDVGAAAGVHINYLKQQGLDVEALDISKGSVEYLRSQGITAYQTKFTDFKDKHYDTLLLLMNGIGIAGELSRLDETLIHAKKLLKEGGRILCDSSDVQYLYLDEDGAMWVDLNTEYYGNFKFQMKYKDHTSDWFNWLYVDFENLKNAAERCGMKATLIYQENENYLAEITLL